MLVFACQNTSFAYENRTVLSGLNFRVQSGDYLCVIGENGSGKSTLLKGLLNLEPVKSGRIIRGLPAGELGYLPQTSAAQKDFPASVYEAALSGRLGRRGFRPFYSRADKNAAQECLQKVNLWPLRRRCFRELSGGQQRRALLARALCAAGSCLVLDEPEAGLDRKSAAEMRRLLKRLNQAGLTIIMASHDLNYALKEAGQILHLQNRQLFYGAAGDYPRSRPGRKLRGGKNV
ncbi:MAG: ATP-binding cassette domain-containing protein [Candidatus Margulisbacteria bacterium]|jgi:zinc transport system ATP-binding protein|nr:ATP-binding cassette domain-containing protein [Candidatus Margulisiibacteriota bacterium]